MAKNTATEHSDVVDLMVVGGGVNGAGTARDAVGRGLSVILCEKDDLAQGTSSRSGVETLIGPQTVNTMPPATYESFRKYGRVAPTLEENVAESERQIKALAGLGIGLEAVTDRLEVEGLAIFVKSFDNPLKHLEHKAASLAT